jgi:hypothetical protein
MRARLDKILNSWVSKKLSVFIVATVLASVGQLDGHEWANIALMYIGTQGAIDAVKQLRSNSN